MMKKNVLVKVAVLSVLCVFMMRNEALAQVTVGSGELPARGALLDIKDSAPDSDNVSSKTGGLIFPRVKLEAINTLAPFIPVNDEDWANPAKQIKTKELHQGLTVYNLSVSTGFEEGLYVWNGEKWEKLSGQNAWLKQGNAGTTPDTDFIGTTDEKGLVFKASNKLTMTMDGKGKTTVYDELHANQSVYLEGDLPVVPSNQAYPLAVDGTTGQVGIVKGDAEFSKAINYVKYEITINGNNSGGDWISSFNTMIPRDKYTVVVVGHSFKTPNVDRQYGTSLLKPNGNVDKNGIYNASEVYADNSSYYWTLKADYIGGGTADGSNGRWDIHCLIINNSMVKVLNTIRGSVAGSSGVGAVLTPIDAL